MDSDTEEKQGECSECGARLSGLNRKTCNQHCARARKLRYQMNYQRETREKERQERQALEVTVRGVVRSATCMVCGGQVPKPRRKYCCDGCYLEASGKNEAEVRRRIERGEHKRRPQGPRGLYPAAKGTVKKRSCLRCGKMFSSQSNGNRICPGCNAKNNDWLGGKDEKYIYVAALFE